MSKQAMHQKLSKLLSKLHPGCSETELREVMREMEHSMIDFFSGGEYSALCGQMSEEVVDFGDSKHKHSMRQQPWDELYGASVKDYTEYTALFRNLYVCVCSRSVIRSERALY